LAGILLRAAKNAARPTRARDGQDALEAVASGTPLPDGLVQRFGAAYGRDLSNVRVHTGSDAAAAADAVDAHAFSVGNDIVFGGGRYAPGTNDGDQLIAHELAHVVQHADGRTGGAPAISAPGDALERDAEAAAARAQHAEPAGARDALSDMGSAFGRSFDDVRVHSGAEAASLTSSLGTQAVTVGKDVYFAPGAFDPSSTEGRRVLAHELTHVAQQDAAAATAPTAAPVGARGNAFEHEATRAADAVLAGQRPEVTMSTTAATAMRDDPPSQTPQQFIDANAAALKTAVSNGIANVSLPTGSPYAQWSVVQIPAKSIVDDIAAFDDAALSAVLQGEDFHAAIQRAANPSPTVEAAAPALVASFTTAIAASYRRLIPQYVIAYNQARWAEESKLGRELAPGESSPVPPREQVIPAHPLDPHTLNSIFGAGPSVDTAKLRREVPAEAKPHDITLLRPIAPAQITLVQSNNKWNWVQVSGIDAPRAEEVAKTLLGGPEKAAYLTGAGSLFGFDPSGQLLEPWKTQYEQHVLSECSTDPNKNKADKPSDPASSLPGGPQTNQTALNQAQTLPGTGADQAAVQDRLRLILTILDDCVASAKPLKMGGELAGVKDRVNQRITQLGTNSAENQQQVPTWDAESAKQRELLTKSAQGLRTAGLQAKSAGAGGGDGPAKRTYDMLMAPAIALGRAWIDVAALSDLPDTAAQKLQAAETRTQLFPVEIAETVLEYVRELLAQTKAAGDASKIGYGSLVGNTAKEEELKGKMVALREAFEHDPVKGQQMLAEMQDDIDTLVLSASMTNTIAQLNLLLAQLEEHRSSILEWIVNPATLGYDSESKHLRGNQARIKDCMEWLEFFRDRVHEEVEAPFSTGTKEGLEKAKANFEKYKTDEVVKEKLDFAAAVIEDANFVQAVAAIAAMLAIGIVSGGLGDIAGAAVVGSEEALVTVGGVAVTTGTIAAAAVESMSVTILSQIIAKEPSGTAAFAEEFLMNFAFAGVFKTVGLHFGEKFKAGEITAGELKATQVASFGAMYTGLTMARCVAKNSEKKEHGGQGITEEEIQEIAVQTAAELVGQAIATHALHHFAEKLQGEGKAIAEFNRQIDEINRLRDEVKKDADTLTQMAKNTPAKALGPKLRDTVTKSNGELQAEEKFLKELELAMSSPGAAGKFTAEDIAKLHAQLGDTTKQLYQQRKLALVTGRTSVAPNHYECGPGELPDVIAKVQEMGGWRQMEITEQGGVKTVRFEPKAGDEAPPEAAPSMLKFTETSPAAAATPKDVTPEQWKSAVRSIAAGKPPAANEIPPTPKNLQAQRKLEALHNDPLLEKGDLAQLRAEFFRELAGKLSDATPEQDLDAKIIEVLQTKGADGNPKYLRRGPALTAADVGKLGGLFRAVTFDTLLGNKMVTGDYYQRLIVGHESEFPATIDQIGWHNSGELMRLVKLMQANPPTPGDLVQSSMLEGRAGASGWWYAGGDEQGASTADALAKALAATNMSNGVVVFELPPDVVAGKIPADVSGGAKATVHATRPTAFDGAGVNYSQFNANPDAAAPTGLTTPEPGSGTSKVREVVIPPVAASSTKWPPRIMPR
jgi:hypothetical protein